MEKKNYLMDVVIIRLVLIFLLVFFHSFAIFCGAWEQPDGMNCSIPVYYWMGYFTHGFRLESMVFISGLLFGYTVTRDPKRLCFNGCVTKKAKRVLLPSVLFSIIYYFFFLDVHAPWYSIIYNILNGSGHMWFLPMIFWCFVLCFVIEKVSVKIHNLQPYKILALCILMNLFAVRSLPFGIGHMMTYFIYFYTGYSIKRSLINFRMLKAYEIILLILLYVSAALVSNYLEGIPLGELITKVVLTFALRSLHLIGALSMVFAIFSFANKTWLQEKLKMNEFLITLSGYCYGVYIYHQFILVFLYYKTSLPLYVSATALPWIGLSITLVLSLLLCHLTLKTKFGRYLIG